MGTGPANFLERLRRSLAAFDLPPHRIVNPDPQSPAVLRAPGPLRIARLDGAVYYAATPRNLYHLLRQRRPGIARRMGWLPRLPAWVVRPATRPLNHYLNRFSRGLLRHAEAVVYQSRLSREMQARMVGAPPAGTPTATILNGVPVDRFHPGVQPARLAGSPRLAITALFRLHKRLQDAIRLLQRLRESWPDATLHVFGEMDVLTREAVEALDCAGVVFHGRVPSDKLPGFYAACDAGLSPSLFDPCPNSVVEMMACGLPVISVAESGAAELLAHPDLVIREGLAFGICELQTEAALPRIDLGTWAARVRMVLDYRRRFADHVLERVETDLRIERVAERYAELIRRAAEREERS